MSKQPLELVVSLHDVAAPALDAVRRFLVRLRETGIDRAVLLVVPHWHGNGRLTGDAETVDALQAWAADGHEICLHGYTHRGCAAGRHPLSVLANRFYTHNEAEFLDLGYDDAMARLDAGLAELTAAGLEPAGFVAPGWLMSRAAVAALTAFPFRYTTTWSRLLDLRSGRRHRAPVVTLSSRSAWRRTASRGWVAAWTALQRRTPLLRIAVHPADLAVPGMEALLLRTIRRAAAERTFTTYSGYLAAWEARHEKER